MRIAFALIVTMASITLKAQTNIPGSLLDYSQRQAFINGIHLNDSTTYKKWFLSKYGGISTSFSFFRGGNASIVAAPIGLQLNRRLNDNFYAFAGVSVAPAYVNFNQSFSTPATNKIYPSNNGFLKSNSFNMYSRAELGLMYINDEKTFSISGSIGVERNNYPMYVYPNNQNNQINNRPPNPVVAPKR